MNWDALAATAELVGALASSELRQDYDFTS